MSTTKPSPLQKATAKAGKVNSKTYTAIRKKEDKAISREQKLKTAANAAAAAGKTRKASVLNSRAELQYENKRAASDYRAKESKKREASIMARGAKKEEKMNAKKSNIMTPEKLQKRRAARAVGAAASAVVGQAINMAKKKK